MNATLELPITEAELLATYPGPPNKWCAYRCTCLTCDRRAKWWAKYGKAAILLAVNR